MTLLPHRVEPQPFSQSLRWVKPAGRPPRYCGGMIAIVYRCPITGLTVDHWVADVAPATKGEIYETMTCRACNRVHIVNLSTGKVLGIGDKEAAL